MKNLKDNLKAINNNLSHQEKDSLLCEFLTMSTGQIINLKNYLESKDLSEWFKKSESGILAYSILCVVAIKNKK